MRPLAAGGCHLSPVSCQLSRVRSGLVGADDVLYLSPAQRTLAAALPPPLLDGAAVTHAHVTAHVEHAVHGVLEAYRALRPGQVALQHGVLAAGGRERLQLLEGLETLCGPAGEGQLLVAAVLRAGGAVVAAVGGGRLLQTRHTQLGRLERLRAERGRQIESIRDCGNSSTGVWREGSLPLCSERWRGLAAAAGVAAAAAAS